MIAAAPDTAMALVLWVAAQGTVTVTDTTQVSTRVAAEGQETPFDFETTPALAGELRFPHAHLSLGYAPMLSLRDAFNEPTRDTVVLHVGSVGAVFDWSHFRLSLSQSGSLGTLTYSRLVLPATDPNAPRNPSASRLDFIPGQTQEIQIVGLTSRAGLIYQWSPRGSSGLAVAYAIWGGRDEPAQLVLPLQKTLSVELSNDYALTRTDQLGTLLSASSIRTSNGFEYLSVGPTQSWSHRFTQASETHLALGTSLLHSRASGAAAAISGVSRSTILFITGSGGASTSVLRVPGVNVTLDAGGGVGPMLTALTGEMQQRAQGAVTLAALFRERTTASVTVDAAQTLPFDAPNAANIFGLGVMVNHTVAGPLVLKAGYRTAWQSSDNSLIGALGRQWVAFVGVAVAAPPLTF